MAQSTPSSARSLSKQAITKTALRVAEEILKDPEKEADAHPLVIQALETAHHINRGMQGEGILAKPPQGIAPRRIFIGEKFAFYDNGGERVAKAMELAGKTPEDIWMQTKTFRGTDGKWRHERADKESKFFDAAAIKGKADAAKEFELAIKQKIEDSKAHPDLFPKQLTQAQKELRGQVKASRESTYGLESHPWRRCSDR